MDLIHLIAGLFSISYQSYNFLTYGNLNNIYSVLLVEEINRNTANNKPKIKNNVFLEKIKIRVPKHILRIAYVIRLELCFFLAKILQPHL